MLSALQNKVRNADPVRSLGLASMKLIRKVFQRYSENARSKRRAIFREYFHIDKATRILDLGSEDGSNIANVLAGSSYDPSNVYIADIDPAAVERGAERYGFQPVKLTENGLLPFDDNYFDIVYCSSVIEHVTVKKADVWTIVSGKEFQQKALNSQQRFADDIRRVGKYYFVQTPCRTFPIESHSWLPLVGMMPRGMQVRLIRFADRFWVKKTIPDFYLLSVSELKLMFPASMMVKEKSFGFTKSLMAVKTPKDQGSNKIG